MQSLNKQKFAWDQVQRDFDHEQQHLKGCIAAICHGTALIGSFYVLEGIGPHLYACLRSLFPPHTKYFATEQGHPARRNTSCISNVLLMDKPYTTLYLAVDPPRSNL